MKKVNFLLYILLILFLYSCFSDSYNPDAGNTEKIKVINQTNEDVKKYYYMIFDIEITKTIIHRDETRFIWVEPGTTYYARGESSNKEYGEGKFVKVPSKYDVQQTWTIK